VSMHELCRKRFAKYERVERQFSKFFDIDDLAVRFDRKADLGMINDLNVSKANDTELKEVSNALGSLNERVKQIAVIQNEIAKSLDPIHGAIGEFDKEAKKQFKSKIGLIS
jgi:transcriptional regulator NrdR family protein